MIEIDGGSYVDAAECFRLWVTDGEKPEYLAEFLKRYPAAAYLSWVQTELTKWAVNRFLFNTDNNFKLLEPGQGQGRDSGIQQIVIDSMIYLDVLEWSAKGYKIVGADCDKSVFVKLQGLKSLSWKRYFTDKTYRGKKNKYPVKNSEIRHRYQRFKNFLENPNKITKNSYSFRCESFFENGQILIGPSFTKDFDDANFFGFWKYRPGNPVSDFDIFAVLFFLPE